VMVVTGWLAYSQNGRLQDPRLDHRRSVPFNPIAPPVQVLPCRLRNRRHLRYGCSRHVIVFEGIERKLDVGICAIKVVGDNGGKPGAPTFEDLM
jgi:hypothetical protein